MASPNEEQLKAIEHNGGVLLKAGAGSGKTFVLKEHMIFLVKKWIKEFKSSNELGTFDSFIKAKFRRVVLMTFTNKAAGELEIRLQKEFNEEALRQQQESDLWSRVLENLSYLNVSTIHGFCLKLIKQGLIKGVSSEQKMLSENEFKKQITDIFERWVETELNKTGDLYSIFLKDKKSLLAALVKIFSDPALRNEWKELNSSALDHSGVDEVCLNLFKFLNLDESFDDVPDLSLHPELSDKKWYGFLTKLCPILKSGVLNLEKIIEVNQFLDDLGYKIPVKPSAKNTPEFLIDYYEGVKKIKDYLKKNGDDFKLFRDSYEDIIEPWFQLIKSLFEYTDNSYKQTYGMIFSDLEYSVYRGLKDEATALAISEQFKYFIVDEFQDTSFLQFSIIENIIQKDYERLFCVGDLKQAIYGFRGGELGVFLNCEKLVPKTLTMKNNYRSTKEVIEFNNNFFDYLFGLGYNFKGIDKKKVPVDYQSVPETGKLSGKINLLEVNLETIEHYDKLTNLEIDYYESLAIFDGLKRNLIEKQQSAVLYKRLKPSLHLIELLISENIGFTAQLKIPFLEDPIMGIFFNLIGSNFDENEKKTDYLQYSLKCYLALLGGEYDHSKVEKNLDMFYLDIPSIGLYHSYLNFIRECGLTTSSYNQNLEVLKDLINESAQDIYNVFNQLNLLAENSYNSDFQYGDNPEQIILMTAHASKGLEFEHVFLAGIYTNENSVMSQDTIGKIPFSFKWKKSIYGKKRYKTPFLMFEEELTKQKEFNESKRLFYVAATRAESNLSFVSLNFGKLKRSKGQSGSWANGLESFMEQTDNNRMSHVAVDITKLVDRNYIDKIKTKAGLVHIDNLGIKSFMRSSDFVLMAELSVTKLSSVVECPKKFYLQNICKLTNENLEILGDSKDTKTKDIQYKYEQEDDLNSKSIKSSSNRGSLIHELLSQKIINSDFTAYSGDEKGIANSINWTVENLKKYVEDFDFISEQPIKFELLGYMISGIPDLICMPKKSGIILELWDFKTGRISEEKLGPYLFQLNCYAYSLYIMNKINLDQPIKLVLCFSDEEKLVEETVSFVDVEKYLMQSMRLLNTPLIENEKSCEYCQFQGICNKSA